MKGLSGGIGQGIGLLFCMDGIPPFKRHKGFTLCPAEFCVLSLPPHLRYKAENMLLYLLVPQAMTVAQQTAIFDYVVDQELTDLHTNGVEGTVVRVLGISLDLRGREKFLRQRACTSFYGCSVCTVCFPSGLRTKLTFTGARSWLPAGSPLRNSCCGDFDFIDEHHDVSPALRTTDSVRDACVMVEEEGLLHYKGI